ncbi:MAG: hypothetical protein AB7T22_10000 [Calditrichaceae bacterium]
MENEFKKDAKYLFIPDSIRGVIKSNGDLHNKIELLKQINFTEITASSGY